METTEKISQFMQQFSDYIGRDFLLANDIAIEINTRFDQLNFDILDQVITEQLIQQLFAMDQFICDSWPETIGQLLMMVPVDHGC